MVILKKLLFVILSLMCFIFSTNICYCNESNVQFVAAKLANFTENIEIETTDLKNYLKGVFEFQPELEFYYKGYNDSSIGNKHNVRFEYINKEVNSEDILISKSEDEFKDIILRSLLYCDDNIYIISNKEYDLESIINEIVDNNPLISMGYKGFNSSLYQSMLTENTCYVINLNYIVAPSELISYKKQTEAKAIEIICENISKTMPDYQKQLVIHDYIAQHTSYSSEIEELDYTPYNALINGKGVCSAYALSAKIMFDLIGIENIYIKGTASNTEGSENHGWNLVKLNDSYYHMDITWDDPIKNSLLDFNYNHDYYNLTDSEISKDHTWDYEAYPICVNSQYNYDNVLSLIGSGKKYNNYYSENDFTSVFVKYKPNLKNKENEVNEILTEVTTQQNSYSNVINYFDKTPYIKEILFILLIILIFKIYI